MACAVTSRAGKQRVDHLVAGHGPRWVQEQERPDTAAAAALRTVTTRAAGEVVSTPANGRCFDCLRDAVADG
jgi:hypothetical protein